MATSSHRLSRTRARLACYLGLRGAGGLLILGAACALAAVLAGVLVEATWDALVAGDVLHAMGAVVAFMLAVTFALMCLSWLFVAAPCPDGVRLERDAAPALHRLIERMQRRFGGVRIDAVWVAGDMNAAIMQRPRWGWFGPMETHLIIGLPLAHSVSRRQFSAILAHELAHLWLQRRGVSAWWGHLRAWWFRALDRCIDDVPVFGRLLERSSASDLHDAMRLARIEEFEADALAARVVGGHLVAEALVEVALKERFLSEDYWRKVMEQSSDKARPLIRPFREMGLGMTAGFRRPAQDSLAMRTLLGQPTSAADFHPALSERLRMLGVIPEVPRGEARSLACACLAPILPTLAWVFDRAWWEASRSDWRRRFERARYC